MALSGPTGRATQYYAIPFDEKNDNWVMYADPKNGAFFYDFETLDGLLQTLKKDRDMRESATK